MMNKIDIASFCFSYRLRVVFFHYHILLPVARIMAIVFRFQVNSSLSAITFATFITIHNRVITAIREHIEPKEPLTCTYKLIRVYKSLHLRIVVTAVAVVELSLGIVEVTSVSDGVYVGNVGCIGNCGTACICYAERLAQTS